MITITLLSGQIFVDLDGTLAEYDGWKGPTHIGAPVPKMLARVKQWLSEGREVVIFTARCTAFELCSLHNSRHFTQTQVDESLSARNAILAWCKEHVGVELPITSIKDYSVVEIWDDRAIAVQKNTGECAMFKENF